MTFSGPIFMLKSQSLAVILLIYVPQMPSNPQTSSSKELSALEKQVAQRFVEARKKYSIKPPVFRNDLRMRKEACRLSVEGGPKNVDDGRWYVSDKPADAVSAIEEIAKMEMNQDHFGVGVWFAKIGAYPDGKYWVFIWPEYSAVAEAFKRHFYLTDSFEYVTPFDREWNKHLPGVCQSIKN